MVEEFRNESTQLSCELVNVGEERLRLVICRFHLHELQEQQSVGKTYVQVPGSCGPLPASDDTGCVGCTGPFLPTNADQKRLEQCLNRKGYDERYLCDMTMPKTGGDTLQMHHQSGCEGLLRVLFMYKKGNDTACKAQRSS